jgi:hypothetical protein
VVVLVQEPLMEMLEDLVVVVAKPIAEALVLPGRETTEDLQLVVLLVLVVVVPVLSGRTHR